MPGPREPMPPGPWIRDGARALWLLPSWDAVIPAEDVALLARWMAVLCELLDSPAVPASAAVTPKMRRYRARLAAAAAAIADAFPGGVCPPGTPQVGGAGHTGPPSEEIEITTVEAARLAGGTRETWRRRARAGKIASRWGPRRVLLLPRAAVLAYDGSGDDGSGTAGEPSQPAGEGPAAGVQAPRAGR